jgi:hypothetical protein
MQGQQTNQFGTLWMNALWMNGNMMYHVWAST